MTVLEAIQKSTEFLGKKNVETPRLQTELLLAHFAQAAADEIVFEFRPCAFGPGDRCPARISPATRGTRTAATHHRVNFFCGHEIIVNRDIAHAPARKRELWPDLACEFIQQSSLPNSPDTLTVLDFCTGSGCLAIAIAAKFPAATIVATDLSDAALAVARENAAKNQVAGRIEFLSGDGFAPLAGRRGSRFDLIISNPPYIPSAEIATLEPEVRDFDPVLALDGGADGLDFYRRLAAGAATFLKPAGKMMLEFGDGQADELKKLFAAEKWIVESVQDDYSHRARILIIKSSPGSSPAV